MAYPEPKSRITRRRTGQRRSNLRLDLAKRVNKFSPVKVYTTAKKSGKKVAKTRPIGEAKAKKPATKKSKK